MNFKLLLLLGMSALATQGAVINSRQKRTLGVATALGTAAAGTLATAATGIVSGAAAVGRGVLIAKPLILGLGGKYALFKYLSEKKRQEGLHFGGSAGFGIGGQGSQVYQGTPTVVENVQSYPTVSEVTFEAAPQVVTYEEPTVVYDQQPTVVYEQKPAVQVVQAQPTVQVVQQQPTVQVVEQQPSFDFDSNIDSYGAPAAPLLW